MLSLARGAFAPFAFLLALSSSAALAQASPRTSVLVGGSTNDAGVAKLFWLQATQNVAGSPEASGSALMMQADSTHVWGDFSWIGSVVCLKAEGARITVGLQLVWGLGTALGQAGKLFYVAVESRSGSGASDLLSNGGYESGAPDCDRMNLGPAGTGAPLVTGGVTVTEVP